MTLKSDWGRALDEHIDHSAEELRDLRRRLHAHPELSGEEYRTTQLIAERLDAAGIPHRLPAFRRGVIAESPGSAEAPRVGMRGDIDALPLHDQKTASYRSMHEGVTHACGHDAHTAMLLGAALALHACRDRLPWPTDWRAIFQPAEETTQGAKEMVAAGAAEGLRCIVALHVDPERALGRVGLRQGHLTAACEELEVTISGEGGHAARPHHTVDTIALATHLVSAVYQFVPRSVDSRDPVVVSFGMIRGGTNANVIPERVQLRGTLRTMGGRTATCVKERILAIAHGLAEASRAGIEVEFRPGADSVFNDFEVTAVCERAAVDVVGALQVDRVTLPSMGSEDFSAYLAHAPGCMLRLGTASSSETSHFLHSPLFDIDERVLAVGAKLLAHCVVQLAAPGVVLASDSA